MSSSQGATVDLPCRLSPSDDLRWSKDRGALPGRASQVRNMLRIENVTVEDSGRYVCTAGGRVQYVTLTVESKDIYRVSQNKRPHTVRTKYSGIF